MQKLIILLLINLWLNANNISIDFPNSMVKNDLVKKGIYEAWYDGATTRYNHGVLGDDIEASILSAKIKSDDGVYTTSIILDKSLVFEDLKPRLADIDNDGQLELVVIQSHQQYGARVAVYKLNVAKKLELFVSTPYIGRRYRWLSISGIADINNDGFMDIAYVDRPHLAKILKVWTYKHNDFYELTRIGNLSNHRIGDDFISGGLKSCNKDIEIITANSDWSYIMSTKFVGKNLVSQRLSKYDNNNDFKKTLLCK